MLKDQKNSRTEISSLGEFKLIDHLAQEIKITHPTTIQGIGDDAAVIGNQEEITLLSTDLLVEGVHFDLTYTPLKHLGYKAAVTNFSDIAAMNALPTQMLVGIALSNRFSVEAIDEIYSGMRLACEQYGVDLVGGDTTASKSGLFISITITGQAAKNKITYRRGAKENDLLCVSGDLGAAYMGLLLLEREKQEFLANPNMQPNLQGNDYVLQRQLKPEARVDIVKLLAEKDILPTSMIDISDGLASEVLHLCKASQTGCVIYENKIPIDAATCQVADEFEIMPVIASLNGGEDYELLFTISQSDYDKVKDLKDIFIIGHITEKASGAMLVPDNGPLIPIQAQGWDGLKL